MLHYCENCEFNSIHKWVVKRHTKSKHEIGLNVQKNLNQASSNIQNQHNTQYGNGQNNPKVTLLQSHSYSHTPTVTLL